MNNSGAEPIVNTKVFKYLVVAGIILILIAGILILVKNSVGGINQSSCATSCVSLPDNFDEIELPAQVGCWRLKLDPNKFSGRVWFPRGTRIHYDLDFEDKNSLVHIRNAFGKIFTFDPKVDGSIGRDNKSIQFKGIGYVKIYITRIWSPMQQF